MCWLAVLTLVSSLAGCGGGSSSPQPPPNPAPTINGLSPSSAAAGAAAQTLTINGANFLSSSTVTYNGTAHSATFLSSAQLTISLTAADQAAAGTFPVVVTNPAPGGGPSNAANFAVNNPVPTITTISPTSARVPAGMQTLTIAGTNFVPGSAVTFNGTTYDPVYRSSVQLVVSISSSDVATAGIYPVVVIDAGPGGGPSNAVNFTVTNPAPTITSISPTSVVAGATAQPLIVNGGNFLPSSTVTYNGTPHVATFGTSQRLTISLTAADLATSGTYPVSVTNPSPGGGSSGAVNFSVLQPGAGFLSLTITGLPANVAPIIEITGPNNYQNYYSQNQNIVFSGLTPGTYTVMAAIRSQYLGSNPVYIPMTTGAPATVIANMTATVNVAYSSLTPAWQPIGPLAIPNAAGASGGAGKLQAFAISNANPSLMFTGGGLGPGNSGPYTQAGIYKTVDGGKTWQQANSGLVNCGPVVDALWMDQNNTNTVVAGTSCGIYQSNDAGATWTFKGYASAAAFLQVGTTLYAATSIGVVQSSDSGGTWNLIESTPVPVVVLSAGGGAIYAGLDDGTVLIQPSSVSPWIAVSPTGSSGSTVWSIAANPTNPLNAFVVEWNNSQVPDLYMSADGGTTWNTVGSITCPVQVVAFDPTSGALYAGCDGSLWHSPDGGNTWAQFAGAAWNVRLIVPAAEGVPANILVGSDQGLYLSPDAGNTWQSLNGDITSSILYGVAVNGSTILATAQGYSPISSFDGGATWQQLQGASPPTGESGSVVINPGNPQYAYVFTLAGFQYSTDGGQTFNPVAALPGSKFSNSGNGDLIAVDRASPSTVYAAAADGVYKSTDWGVSWTLQPWPVSQASMVAVDPTDSMTIIVGEEGNAVPGSLLVTHDGAKTWTTPDVSNPCGGSPVSAAFDPSNPQNIFVGMSSSCGGTHFYFAGILSSTDGGTTFTSFSGGLGYGSFFCPNTAVPHIVFDPSGSGIMAAAANSGLFLSSDLGANWISVQGNAVSSCVTQPVFMGGYLYLSTFGEGVIRMPFAY